MERFPFIFSNCRRFVVLRHTSFWVFWWLFQGFLYAFAPYPSTLHYIEKLPVSMLDSLVYMPAHIFLAYSLVYFVVPKYLIREKYLAAAIIVVLLFIATAVFGSSLGKFMVWPVRNSFFPGLQLPHPNTKEVFYLSLLAGLRGSITIGGIAAAIKLMKYWYIKEQKNLQLQKENAASQLQLLKAQVHPHFLFNTLNNIYSYTQETAPFAAELVSKLSDLLRYVLYEGNAARVLLSKELKMIEDYVGLEKVRYGNKLDLNIRFPEKTDHLYIAPLLLLPLVENCFKHGTSHMIDQPWISMHITLDHAILHLKLLNGKVDQPEETASSGIGIRNVQKRLELLYPGKHSVSIADEAEVFIINLRLELDFRPEPQLYTLSKNEAAHA
jgi:hypothetical protein